jgi:hypothetical protein
MVNNSIHMLDISYEQNDMHENSPSHDSECGR